MEPKVKSFWERPEGTTGKVFLGLIGLGALFGVYHILPVIIVLMQNTLYAGFLFAALGATTFIALDSRVHALVGFGYKSIMRGITKAFVQLDPIAIVETYVREMEHNREKMNKQISNLRGQMRSLQQVIQSNDKERENNLRLAERAKQQGANDLVTLKARKAGRLQNSNITLQTLFSKMELLYRVLDKMYTTSDYLVQDVQDEIEVKKKERAALTAGSNAFRSAMQVIKGDPDKKYMFDAAMEYMVDDISAKVGEMERFMEISSSFMQSVDLQNGIYEDEGLKQLEDWTKSGASSLLGAEKTLLINKASNHNDVLDLDAPLKTEVRPGNKYSKLFEEVK